MQYKRLGRSGLQVSALSLGSWVTYHNQVDVNAAKEMLAAAFDAGVNFFDNAEVYASGASEQVMGDAIKALNDPSREVRLSGVRLAERWLSTPDPKVEAAYSRHYIAKDWLPSADAKKNGDQAGD